MLGDPVGPVRIAPLVAPVRAVLARPCGPSDTLLGPLDRAIAPGFRLCEGPWRDFVLRR